MEPADRESVFWIPSLLPEAVLFVRCVARTSVRGGDGRLDTSSRA